MSKAKTKKKAERIHVKAEAPPRPFLPPLDFDRDVRLVPFSEAAAAFAARFPGESARALGAVLVAGLVRSVLVDATESDGVLVKRWRELAPMAWHRGAWVDDEDLDGETNERFRREDAVLEQMRRDRLAEAGEWYDAGRRLGTVYLVASDLGSLTGGQVREAVEAVVRRARDEASRVVLAAAAEVKRAGREATSANVQATMTHAGTLVVHPKRGGTPSWLEVFDTDRESLGEMERSWFRALAARARNS